MIIGKKKLNIKIVLIVFIECYINMLFYDLICVCMCVSIFNDRW